MNGINRLNSVGESSNSTHEENSNNRISNGNFQRDLPNHAVFSQDKADYHASLGFLDDDPTEKPAKCPIPDLLISSVSTFLRNGTPSAFKTHDVFNDINEIWNYVKQLYKFQNQLYLDQAESFNELKVQYDKQNVFLRLSLKDLPIFAHCKQKLLGYHIHWNLQNKKLVYFTRNCSGEHADNDGTFILKCVKRGCPYLLSCKKGKFQKIFRDDAGEYIEIEYCYVKRFVDHTCSSFTESDTADLAELNSLWANKKAVEGGPIITNRMIIQQYIKDATKQSESESQSESEPQPQLQLKSQSQISAYHRIEKLYSKFEITQDIFRMVSFSLQQYYIFIMNRAYLDGSKQYGSYSFPLMTAFRNLLSFHPKFTTNHLSIGKRNIDRYITTTKTLYSDAINLIGNLFAIFLLICIRMPKTYFVLRYDPVKKLTNATNDQATTFKNTDRDDIMADLDEPEIEESEEEPEEESEEAHDPVTDAEMRRSIIVKHDSTSFVDNKNLPESIFETAPAFTNTRKINYIPPENETYNFSLSWNQRLVSVSKDFHLSDAELESYRLQNSRFDFENRESSILEEESKNLIARLRAKVHSYSYPSLEKCMRLRALKDVQPTIENPNPPSYITFTRCGTINEVAVSLNASVPTEPSQPSRPQAQAQNHGPVYDFDRRLTERREGQRGLLPRYPVGQYFPDTLLDNIQENISNIVQDRLHLYSGTTRVSTYCQDKSCDKYLEAYDKYLKTASSDHRTGRNTAKKPNPCCGEISHSMATFITSVLRTFPIDPITLQKKINEKFPLEFRKALQSMSLRKAPYCITEMFIAPDVSLNFVDMLTPILSVNAKFLRTNKYGSYTILQLISKAVAQSLPGVTHYECTNHNISNCLRKVKLVNDNQRKRFVRLFKGLQVVVDQRKASLLHKEMMSMISDSNTANIEYISDLTRSSYAYANRPRYNQITNSSVKVTNDLMKSVKCDHPWSISRDVFSLVHKQINNEWRNYYNKKHYGVLKYDDKPLIPGLTYSMSFSIGHIDDYNVDNFENNQNEYVVTLREDSVLMFYFKRFPLFEPTIYPGLHSIYYGPYDDSKKAPIRKTRLNEAFSQKYYHVDLANHCCSCKFFQQLEYPCIHALKVIMDKKLKVSDYCHKRYHMEFATKVFARHSKEYKNVAKFKIPEMLQAKAATTASLKFGTNAGLGQQHEDIFPGKGFKSAQQGGPATVAKNTKRSISACDFPQAGLDSQNKKKRLHT